MASVEPAGGGYHGGVAPAISVEEVARQALEIARDVGVAELDALAGDKPHLRIDDLHAGYGQMEILHGLSLRVGHKQSLVPDRPERRRQIDRAAFHFRLHQ